MKQWFCIINMFYLEMLINCREKKHNHIDRIFCKLFFVLCLIENVSLENNHGILFVTHNSELENMTKLLYCMKAR